MGPAFLISAFLRISAGQTGGQPSSRIRRPGAQPSLRAARDAAEDRGRSRVPQSRLNQRDCELLRRRPNHSPRRPEPKPKPSGTSVEVRRFESNRSKLGGVESRVPGTFEAGREASRSAPRQTRRLVERTETTPSDAARSMTRPGRRPSATDLPKSKPGGRVAELADALDLGSSGETHQSSSLCVPKTTTAAPACPALDAFAGGTVYFQGCPRARRIRSGRSAEVAQR
jgi:hypothetical protein